jgi:acyl-CoA thioesterase FadM
MLQKSFTETPIVFRAAPVTPKQIENFALATTSEHYSGFPLTFATIFRAAEFMWLDRLKFDMRELLHTDQEYEYIGSLKEGDVPTIYTRITDFRERRGMTFVILESEVRCDEKLVILARSSFVVRKAQEATP